MTTTHTTKPVRLADPGDLMQDTTTGEWHTIDDVRYYESGAVRIYFTDNTSRYYNWGNEIRVFA